jgi:hypothetical protein
MNTIDRDRLRWQRIRAAEDAGVVADSTEARAEIVDRIKSGELTLDEGQAMLRRIQRDAHKNGMVTQHEAGQGKLP